MQFNRTQKKNYKINLGQDSRSAVVLIKLRTLSFYLRNIIKSWESNSEQGNESFKSVFLEHPVPTKTN